MLPAPDVADLGTRCRRSARADRPSSLYEVDGSRGSSNTRAAVAVLIIALGCSLSSELAPIRVGAANKIPEDEGVVFGKILFNGRPATSVDIVLLPPGSTVTSVAPVNEDGSFCWHLPPGRAVLTTYRTTGGANGIIGAEFTVPAPGNMAYVGTLSVMSVRTSNILSYMPRGIVAVKVEDDPDQSAVEACGRSVSGQRTHALMEIKRR